LEKIAILVGNLKRRLYDDLRNSLNIAYTPDASSAFNNSFVLFMIATDLLYEDKQQAAYYLRTLVDELQADGTSESEFCRAKNRYTTAFAFKDNINTDLIDFYHDYLNCFDKKTVDMLIIVNC
jgi:predicted Zn-dependent peptidase